MPDQVYQLGALTGLEKAKMDSIHWVWFFSQSQYLANDALYTQMLRTLQKRYQSPIPVQYDASKGTVYITVPSEAAAPPPAAEDDDELAAAEGAAPSPTVAPQPVPLMPPPVATALPREPNRTERRKKKSRR